VSSDAQAAPTPPSVRALGVLALIALVIGAANGVVFLGFEWVVKHGTDWIWNDLVDSDDVRWRVIPLAIVLSVAFGLVVRFAGEARWVPPHLDPLGAAEESEDAPAPTLRSLAAILAVGIASLLAGAALGPEAPLVAFAAGLGGWVAARAAPGPAGRLFVLASAGALLVAFFGSLVSLLIPLALLVQRTKRLPVPAVLAVVIAGLAAWGMLWLIHGNDQGFGAVPDATVHARDYVAAFVLGLVAVGIGLLLRHYVVRLAALTVRIDRGAAWWLAAAAFGGVLGVLYLIGGQTIQFSGGEGSAMLIARADEYGAWALAGIALLKLLATSWSLACGYRGGLVFPSVFAGVAASLCVAAFAPSVAGPGIMLGAIIGLLCEMTAPILGIVVLLALVPLKLVPLGLAGAIGAVAGRRVVDRLASRTQADLRETAQGPGARDPGV
jgi:H+/Cl- antiporter ClcA